jgi:hypothetical protein
MAFNRMVGRETADDGQCPCCGDRGSESLTTPPSPG